MNTQPDKSGGGAGQGARPMVIIGILAVAALVVLAAALLLKPKPPAPGSEPGSTAEAAPEPGQVPPRAAPATEPQPGKAEPPRPAVTAKAAATGAVAQARAPGPAPLNDLIKALKDRSLSLNDRKEAIKALAQNGSPEAIAALKEALASGDEELRAAIAEGLGECASPECTTLLLGLLNDSSEAVIQGAIRGLAQRGSPEAIAALGELVYNEQRSPNIRSEAITGLGNIDQAGAMEVLSRAAKTIGDEDIVAEVIEAIGGRRFSETQSFFQEYMASAPSGELRVTAMESLWQAKGDPTAFLLGYASDPDPEVRAAAAWAMSATDDAGKAGPQLLGVLQSEQDPEVRSRLYQALRNQEGFNTERALALVQQERDPSARVAGLDFLANTLHEDPTPALEYYFEQTAAPELAKAALTAEMKDDRMAAAMALIRANTPAALLALQKVAQESTDPRIKRAASTFVANPPPAMPKPSR